MQDQAISFSPIISVARVFSWGHSLNQSEFSPHCSSSSAYHRLFFSRDTEIVLCEPKSKGYSRWLFQVGPTSTPSPGESAIFSNSHYFHSRVCLTRCRFALVVMFDWRKPLGNCNVHSVGITAKLRPFGALAPFLLAQFG
jgi:hypothetical protein